MKTQAQAAFELQRCANDLRNAAQVLQRGARAGGLNQARGHLDAMADLALKVALQVEAGQRKAVRGTLTEADIERIAAAVDPMTSSLHLKHVKHVTMDTVAFQNFDHKSNQLMNLLSAVIKAMNEMGGIGAGSRSGL
jgi:hypothetical protein